MSSSSSSSSPTLSSSSTFADGVVFPWCLKQHFFVDVGFELSFIVRWALCCDSFKEKKTPALHGGGEWERGWREKNKLQNKNKHEYINKLIFTHTQRHTWRQPPTHHSWTTEVSGAQVLNSFTPAWLDIWHTETITAAAAAATTHNDYKFPLLFVATSKNTYRHTCACTYVCMPWITYKIYLFNIFIYVCVRVNVRNSWHTHKHPPIRHSMLLAIKYRCFSRLVLYECVCMCVYVYVCMCSLVCVRFCFVCMLYLIIIIIIAIFLGSIAVAFLRSGSSLVGAKVNVSIELSMTPSPPSVYQRCRHRIRHHVCRLPPSPAVFWYLNVGYLIVSSANDNEDDGDDSVEHHDNEED